MERVNGEGVVLCEEDENTEVKNSETFEGPGRDD
jgi:hypothetical protein